MNHSSARTPAVQIFNFQSNHAVRVAFDDNGEPLFCLRDVADILDIQNVSQIVAKQLNEKGVYKIYTLTDGGKQAINFINEPNLYRVIFRSNKPEAVKFQNWVFDEVLPTLRKTGSYTIAEPSAPAPKPQSPRLSQSDINNIRVVVRQLGQQMYHKTPSINIIYARLNTLCGTQSIQDARQDQLAIIQNELCRIERILRTYINHRHQAEKHLIRRICIGDEAAVWQAMHDIDSASHDFIIGLDGNIGRMIAEHDMMKLLGVK